MSSLLMWRSILKGRWVGETTVIITHVALYIEGALGGRDYMSSLLMWRSILKGRWVGETTVIITHVALYIEGALGGRDYCHHYSCGALY